MGELRETLPYAGKADALGNMRFIYARCYLLFMYRPAHCDVNQTPNI
jgi:hypothetical protein